MRKVKSKKSKVKKLGATFPNFALPCSSKGRPPAGFTILEALIVILVLSVILGISAATFITSFRTLSTEQSRGDAFLEITEKFERTVVNNIRLANLTSVTGTKKDRVNYRVSIGGTKNFVLYFHNPKNTGLGTYDQPSYNLRRATTAAFARSFTYGAGEVLMHDLLPPPSFYTSSLPTGRKAIVMDLTVVKGSDTFRVRQEAFPRN